MRVAWVHPSWRDLVIDDLATDAGARLRFLTAAGLDGVLLALSTAGGAHGERLLPLLVADADWDALGDRVHALAAELEPLDHARLLDALAAAAGATAGREPQRHREVVAIAEQALGRATARWSRVTEPLDVDLLRSWYALAECVGNPPPPPPLDRTWAALLPAGVELDPPSELERARAWIALCEILAEHDRQALQRLGFFDRDAALAAEVSVALKARASEERASEIWDPFAGPEDLPAPAPGPFLDVDRILRDLA